MVGGIIKRFEEKRFRLAAMNFLQASEEHLKQCLSIEHPLFPALGKYMNSGPMEAIVW